LTDQGRLLGIDPGTKRIGFAISDDMRWHARPLEVWKRRSIAEDLEHVRALIEEHEVTGLVVGVPYSLEGRETESTGRAKAFIAELRAAFPQLPLSERDEALTTWEAQERMKEAGIEPRRELIDAYAAAVILQEELDVSGR
jgi:putative Holliday junction resolvase